ncbi:MAG: xanthine dehydrogenase family protein molybdopterin-binding subunit [Flavobacteriaceae bacterium]|nr:xanthine dehydrogenase family protein molybdopterin-binding subunit [Flavobacteriaceae bacterium]
MEEQIKSKGLSRRKFVGVIGGGVVFLVAAWKLAPDFLLNEEGLPIKSYSDFQGQKVTVWVQIHEDDFITIYNPSSEMGQGSMTALAVIIAEELDADWSKVTVEQSPADPDIYGIGWGGRGPGSMITVGSRTVMSYYNNLRQAGAQARYVLLATAATSLGVSIDELTTEPNKVIHKASNRQMSYGELANIVKPIDEVPEVAEAKLKNPANFRLIGKVGPRFDIPSKCNGSAEYAIDIQVPNMIYGVISRSPVYGARPALLNRSDIINTPGVLDVVELDHGIGLLTETLELALKTKPRLRIEWSKGNTADEFNSEEAYDLYPEIAGQPLSSGSVISERGNITNALNSGVKNYSSNYKNDFVYHAQQEPLNAVVAVAEDGQSAEAWVGTQAPGSCRNNIAQELGIDPSKVNFHRAYLGGGFGRRSASDFAVEATQLAKVAKRPVKLIWTREDDLQYGMFRPQSLQHMEASIDNSNKVIAWKHIIVGTGNRLMGSGAETQYYSIPNQHIESRNVNHGVRTKHWRAVGHGPNKFAIESFVDEIATDLKIDPLDFRLNLMKDFPRAQNVLKTVAEMADWKTPSPSGRAKGIAFAERSNSLSACVCELSVDDSSGIIRVHKIWAALDAGVVVQPDNAIAQMEGAILMGMSSILKESVTFRNGKVEQSNFHDYNILRMDEIPDTLEVKIISSTERPTGIGESGVPIIGGAIGNAFANLTGKRLKHIPFTPAKVKAILAA